MNLWFIIDHQLPGYPGSFYLCRVTLSMHKLPWKNIPLLIFEPGCVDYEQYRDCLVFINSGVRLQNMDTWTSNSLPTGRNAKVELMCCRRSKLRMSISGRVTSINLHTYSESVFFARSFYIRIDNWFWHESPENDNNYNLSAKGSHFIIILNFRLWFSLWNQISWYYQNVKEC